MTTPYTYLVTFVDPGTWEVKVYYGVRYAHNCDPSDLFTTYFTSSIYVKDLILKHGLQCFSSQVRRTFSTREEALQWEQKVLRRMKVLRRDDFINKAVGMGVPTLYGEDNPSSRPEVRAKISLSKVGKKYSDEHRANISRALTGRSLSPEHRKKNSDTLRRNLLTYGPTMKGRHHSTETCRKIGIASSQRTHSSEVKAKIANSNKGKVRSGETRRRLSLSHLGNKVVMPVASCKVCGYSASVNLIARWHDSNCRKG